MSEESDLKYSSKFWTKKLKFDVATLSTNEKCDLVFSLTLYLALPLFDLFYFIFASSKSAVRQKAGRFMGYFASGTNDTTRFPPATIFDLWHQNFPKARPHLQNMITPLAQKLVLEESDMLVKNQRLKVKINELTHTTLPNLPQPHEIAKIYRSSAPFTWGMLEMFSASPNRHRKSKKVQDEDCSSKEDKDDWNDDPNLDEDDPAALKNESAPQFKGFSRNPFYVRRKLHFPVTIRD